MDITIQARNCEIPARLKEEARAKLEHATRIFDRFTDAEMRFKQDVAEVAEPAVVEITARTKGQVLRALGAASDHRAAVDVAISRFERQLRRLKARKVSRRRGRGQEARVPIHPIPVETNGQREESAFEPRIVRRKQHHIHPMLPEDAAAQLELLGHDFYLFTNSATGQANVVYRRRDGDIGLIEPAAADELIGR